MNDSSADPHCPGVAVARSDVGVVTTCQSCGVITLTLQYLSLRFEPAAFRELLGMLAFAQGRLDADSDRAALQATCSATAPPVH